MQQGVCEPQSAHVRRRGDLPSPEVCSLHFGRWVLSEQIHIFLWIALYRKGGMNSSFTTLSQQIISKGGPLVPPCCFGTTKTKTALLQLSPPPLFPSDPGTQPSSLSPSPAFAHLPVTVSATVTKLAVDMNANASSVYLPTGCLCSRIQHVEVKLHISLLKHIVRRHRLLLHFVFFSFRVL